MNGPSGNASPVSINLDYQEALQVYGEAIKEYPTSLWLWHKFCELHVSIYGLDQTIARVCNEKATKPYPSNPALVIVLSEVYATSGQYRDAVSTYMEHFERGEFQGEKLLSALMAEFSEHSATWNIKGTKHTA